MPYDYCDWYDLGTPDFEMDPDDTEAFDISLASDLDGDTITAIDVISQDGLTIDDDSFEDSSVRIVVSGGSVCRSYRVTIRYTTAASLQRDKTITILVRDH